MGDWTQFAKYLYCLLRAVDALFDSPMANTSDDPVNVAWYQLYCDFGMADWDYDWSDYVPF